MFASKRFFFFVALIIALLLSTACQTYQASVGPNPEITPSQARANIDAIYARKFPKGHSIELTDTAVVVHVTRDDNTPGFNEFKYDDRRSTYQDDWGAWEYGMDDSNGYKVQCQSMEEAILMAKSMGVLIYAHKLESADAGNTLDGFDKVAESYHASPKHDFPEDAHRYRAVAEQAFKDKEYQKAIDNYKLALQIVPWWPEGHYNRGLLLGQQGMYKGAVIELKKYLMLVPDAVNARTAKDKIYVWEAK